MVNLKLFQERKMPMDRDAPKIITNEIRGGRLYLCKVRNKSVKGRGGGHGSQKFTCHLLF